MIFRVRSLRLSGARQRPLLSSNLDPDTEVMRLWLLFQDSFRAVSQYSIMPDGRDKSSSIKSYISIYYRNSETFPVVPSSSLRTRLLGRETSSVPIFLDSSPHFHCSKAIWIQRSCNDYIDIQLSALF